MSNPLWSTHGSVKVLAGAGCEEFLTVPGLAKLHSIGSLKLKFMLDFNEPMHWLAVFKL